MAVVGTQYGQTLILDAAGETVTRIATYVNGAAVTWTPTFTSLGSGRYLMTYTPAQAGHHSGVFSGSVTGDFTVDFDVQTVAQADFLASPVGGAAGTVGGALARLEVMPIEVAAPVRPSNDAELTQGDDYLAADGRAPQWTASGWPVLTGATAALTIWDRTGAVALTKAGTVTPATPLVSVDLTRVETAALPVGGNRYAVVATLADGSVATLATGILTVTPSPP